MKWFKHMSNMSQDPKIKNLEQWYGLEGYARWIKILEVIASDMDETDRCSVTLDERIWKDILCFYRNKDMGIYLQSMVDLGLISVQSMVNVHSMSGRSITILCPNLLKIRARQNLIGGKTRRTEEDKEVDIEEDKEREVTRKALSPLSEKWNSICYHLPKVISNSKSRQQKERLRLKEYSVHDLDGAMAKIQASGFCKGKNDRGWVATYDWFIANDQNILKILEGKYDDRKALEPVSSLDKIRAALMKGS